MFAIKIVTIIKSEWVPSSSLSLPLQVSSLSLSEITHVCYKFILFIFKWNLLSFIIVEVLKNPGLEIRASRWILSTQKRFGWSSCPITISYTNHVLSISHMFGLSKQILTRLDMFGICPKFMSSPENLILSCRRDTYKYKCILDIIFSW